VGKEDEAVHSGFTRLRDMSPDPWKSLQSMSVLDHNSKCQRTTNPFPSTVTTRATCRFCRSESVIITGARIWCAWANHANLPDSAVQSASSGVADVLPLVLQPWSGGGHEPSSDPTVSCPSCIPGGGFSFSKMCWNYKERLWQEIY
jgi:hypothetical protein